VPSPARALALRLLLDVEGGGSTLADLLAAPEVQALSRRDRALLHELVLGTLRHRGAVDAAVLGVVDRPLKQLDRQTLASLRLGAYQLLRMRVPPHAAVSEAVDLARTTKSRGAGLVNAALRRLAREGPPPLPDPRADPALWLTSEGSLPEWLAARWLRRLGPEAAVARARAFLAVPPATFRLNPRIADALAQAEQAGLAPQALAIPGAFRATSGGAGELASAGVVYVQDAGSQMAARLAARAGLVLDACAAPGGKALLMADLAGESGRVVALESSPRRLRALAALALRWESEVLCVGGDALRPPFSASFDGVLLDAPCSGLGTLARHPDIRWRMREAEVRRQADRQSRILESVSALVRPGGRLVYSVCSGEPEEGEAVVGAFLASHPDFNTAPPPDWSRPFLGTDGFLRTSPERDGGDAFFLAVLDRA
jgi:16S rRNA (cytosine967-C5)-methyltransferase